MPKNKTTHNYFVFVFVENYPPICVGQVSGSSPSDARNTARREMSESVKYGWLLSLGIRMQTAKAVH